MQGIDQTQLIRLIEDEDAQIWALVELTGFEPVAPSFAKDAVKTLRPGVLGPFQSLVARL